MAANTDLTRDIPQILENLYLNGTGPIKGYSNALITQAVPTTAVQAAGLQGVAIFAATTTVTGAAVGDIVSVGAPTVALANLADIFGVVTAANTVQLYARSTPAAFVTGAARTFTVSVAKV